MTQDVFVKLLQHRHRLKSTYPSSLLYRIATNLCLNRLRDNGRLETDADDLILRLAALDDTHADLEARSILGFLFGKHQESSRVIAVLHFVDGLTLEQVAREVGMSVSGVRKRIRAMRQTLAGMESP